MPLCTRFCLSVTSLRTAALQPGNDRDIYLAARCLSFQSRTGMSPALENSRDVNMSVLKQPVRSHLVAYVRLALELSIACGVVAASLHRRNDYSGGQSAILRGNQLSHANDGTISCPPLSNTPCSPPSHPRLPLPDLLKTAIGVNSEP